MDIRHYLTSAHILKGTVFFHYNLHVLPPTLIWLPPHISGSPLSDLGQWELSGRRSGGLISLLIGWLCLVGVITHPLWLAMCCHCSTESSIKVWTLRTSTHANILQIWILVMCRSSTVHSERCEEQSLIFNVWPLWIRRCDNFLNGYQVKKSFIMPIGLYKRSRSFRRNIIPYNASKENQSLYWLYNELFHHTKWCSIIPSVCASDVGLMTSFLVNAREEELFDTFVYRQCPMHYVIMRNSRSFPYIINIFLKIYWKWIFFKPHWVCTKYFLYDDAHDDDQRRCSSNCHQTHPLTKYTGCLWSFLCVCI